MQTSIQGGRRKSRGKVQQSTSMFMHDQHGPAGATEAHRLSLRMIEMFLMGANASPRGLLLYPREAELGPTAWLSELDILILKKPLLFTLASLGLGCYISEQGWD